MLVCFLRKYWLLEEFFASSLLQGRALRHALDAKVRKLRAMVSADEDVTTELDKVVCRLMKLALRSSKSRTCAPPPKWMQYKLLDLLTLTEKTIAKRRQRCVVGMPLKAIEFGQSACMEIISLSKFKNDTTAAEILNKYRNIMSFSDIDSASFLVENIKDKTDIDNKVIINDEIKLERTQAWVEKKNQDHVVDFPLQNESLNSSTAKQLVVENERRRCSKKRRKFRDKKLSETKLKKVLPTKSSSHSLLKRYKRYLAFHERRHYNLKSKEQIKDHQILQSRASKPIPGSIIDLCHPELRIQKNIDCSFKNTVCNNVDIDKTYTNNATIEESLLVDIVMDDTALHRTIGTDADDNSVYREQEAILNSIMNAATDNKSHSVQLETENFESQSIFINDINEPSTSKGIRHVSMECGTDPIPPSHVMPSPVSSLTKMPEIFTTGIKIEDSKTNFMKMDGDDSPPKLLTRAKSPSIFSKGITIEDSTTNILMKNDSLNLVTFVSEEELTGLFHAKARGITIEDSLTNMRKKRSLDFGGLKNDEKCLPIKPGHIQNVFDIKKTNTAEKDFCIRTESKTGNNDTNQLPNEQCKVRISKKFSPRAKDDSPSEIVTHGENIDSGTSDDNYINNINQNRTKTTPIKYCTFCTSTDKNLQSTPRLIQSVGVKSKESNTNVTTKPDCGTGIVAELLSGPAPSTPLKCNFLIETKPVEPIASSMKTENLCSEFNDNCVLVRCPTMHLNYMGRGKENLSPERQMKLCRGGVHVHSYKEKQVSEDVMFQGEWQRHKPKTNTRRTANKKVIDSVLRKRRTTSKEIIQNKRVESKIKNITDSTPKKKRMSSKDRVMSKKPEKFENKVDQKKPVQVRRPKFEKHKEDNLTKTLSDRKNFMRRDATNKSIRPNRSVVKVSSKIAVSSISSKTRNTLVVKKSAMVCTAVNKDDDKREKRLKNYIPRYLLRRKIREAQQLSLYDAIKFKKSQANLQKKEIQKQLIEFNLEPVNRVSYAVFRNEVEELNNTSTENQATSSVKEIISKNMENIIGKRNTSPGSSTCSTSDSITTVKPVSTRSKVSTKKYSTPSSKSAINSESDCNTPVKSKKNAKKAATKKDDIDFDNKENIPESSHKFNECLMTNMKSAFTGRNKSVFMARLATDSATKSKDQSMRKSKFKVPVKEDKNVKKICVSPAKIKSTSYLESKENKTQEIILDVPSFSQIADILDQSFELGSNQLLNYSEDSTDEEKNSNNTVKTEWFNCTQHSAGSTESTIQAAMRRIVEDSLEFAFRSSAFKDYLNYENLGLCCENCRENVEDALSPISYKTTLQENFNSNLLNELEDALNRSFDLATAIDDGSLESFAASMTDNTDVFSFKSTSEYFLGEDTIIDNNNSHSPNSVVEFEKSNLVEERPVFDNVKVDFVVGKMNTIVEKVDSVVDKIESADKHEPSSSKAGSKVASKEKSVRDIYERKGTLISENPGGSLAIQAFSGFSMNTDTVAGDQPDYVNLIDSETGSLAVDITRQATSEEVFVSGRSSESFQSCLMDEDAVVPNWLFNIIQQQQSVNIPVPEEDDEILLPMVVPLPMSEPVYDMNGNATEPGVGVGAGAGDGRGIHSDNSQDSSGRGTSLTSSATSSGAQSEAILMDPSAFTAQFELLRESVVSSTAVTTLVVPGSIESMNPMRRTEESSIEAESTSTSGNDAAPSRRDGRRRYHTSDVDADVSSIDTDIPDSSDN